MVKFDFAIIAMQQAKQRRLGSALGMNRPITSGKNVSTGFNIQMGKLNVVGIGSTSVSNNDLIRTNTLAKTYGSSTLNNNTAAIL